MSLIELKNISKGYDLGTDSEVHALRNINLAIEQGEFVAVMGPSGSGKSSLMHLIGFLDRPTSGEYIFENDEIHNMSDDQLAAVRNEKVGFVFQAFNLLPRTTALDNVALPMIYAQKYSAEEINRRAFEMLKQVGLESRVEHMPSELSGGQQQRVAIARALINNPSVIFADEPTGNLDSKSTAEIMGIFAELNSEGRTLMFVTHEDSVAAYAKRILRLQDGEIISDQKNTSRRPGSGGLYK